MAFVSCSSFKVNKYRSINNIFKMFCRNMEYYAQRTFLIIFLIYVRKSTSLITEKVHKCFLKIVFSVCTIISVMTLKSYINTTLLFIYANYCSTHLLIFNVFLVYWNNIINKKSNKTQLNQWRIEFWTILM